MIVLTKLSKRNKETTRKLVSNLKFSVGTFCLIWKLQTLILFKNVHKYFCFCTKFFPPSVYFMKLNIRVQLGFSLKQLHALNSHLNYISIHTFSSNHMNLATFCWSLFLENYFSFLIFVRRAVVNKLKK